jgi:hypothetical protein
VAKKETREFDQAEFRGKNSGNGPVDRRKERRKGGSSGAIT